MLNCKASSDDGKVLYRWEERRFQQTQWTVVAEKMIDGNSYITYTTSSRQYRCVASNDAGETASEIANITVLSKIPS